MRAWTRNGYRDMCVFLLIRPRTPGRGTGSRRVVALFPVWDVRIKLYARLDLGNCHVVMSRSLCKVPRCRRRRGSKRRKRQHNYSDQWCDKLCSALQHLLWVPVADAFNGIQPNLYQNLVNVTAQLT